MNISEILSKCDHTLLAQSATWEEIKAVCDDGIRYSTASVCIPASYVKRAAEYAAGRVAVCTVIGFPNGYNSTETKCAETRDAIKNGGTAPVPTSQILYNQAIIDGIARSAELGREVEIVIPEI